MIPTVVLALAGLLGRAQEPPSFVHDVGPLVHAKCAGCHRPDGAAPFELVSYEDLRRRARQIGEVAARRIMPPWKPAAGHGESLDARTLAADEIELVRRWVAAGAPRGRGALAAPRFADGWSLRPPDLVVVAPEPYSVPAEGVDVWRCFVIPLELEEILYVRAVEIRPSNPRAVPHVILYPDRAGLARERDASLGSRRPATWEYLDHSAQRPGRACNRAGGPTDGRAPSRSRPETSEAAGRLWVSLRRDGAI